MPLSFTSQRVAQIPFASIWRIVDKARYLDAQGEKVVHFEVGRPFFNTPPHIIKAASLAMEKGMVHYAANTGLPELRQAMTDNMALKKNIQYKSDSEILVTAGGQEAIYVTFQALLEPGDEILIPDPGYEPYPHSIKLAGGVAVSMPLLEKENFCPDLEAVHKLVNNRTRGIIINSPHNPTGGVLTAAQIKKLCDFAVEHNLLIFSDEAYDQMLYEGRPFISPASLPNMKERTIIWGSLSKTYAMTGWRIGYIAGPAEMINSAIKIQQNLMISVCTFAQAGAIEALRGSQDCLDEMLVKFAARRQVILNGIDKIPGLSCPTTPYGAFYAFVKHEIPNKSSDEVAEFLIDRGKVAVVPGTAFGAGGEGYLRFSYAMSPEICQEGIDRITPLIHELMNR